MRTVHEVCSGLQSPSIYVVQTLYSSNLYLFISKNWKCDYSGTRKITKSRKRATDNPGQRTSTFSPRFSLGRHESEYEKFPVAFFLDAGVFKTLNLQVPRAHASVPTHVTELLGDSFSIQETVSHYFRTVQGWMAILSKKRFYVQQFNPLTQRNTNATLLLLCIKLIVWAPSTAAKDSATPLYTAAKRFHSELVTMGVCSIQILQAGILIALYEIGHCIYPAAYMSIGACARYGTAFGFDSKEPSCAIEVSDDWMDVEEVKRAWWAIMILDRFVTRILNPCLRSDTNWNTSFVTLGNPKRVLVTQEPGMDSVLPVDDTAWNEGVYIFFLRFLFLLLSRVYDILNLAHRFYHQIAYIHWHHRRALAWEDLLD